MNIGIDLDGVCYPFVEDLHAFAVVSGYDPKTLTWPKSWNFFIDQWGWTMDEYFEVFGEGVRRGRIFWDNEPEPGCVPALTKLRDEGHSVTIITQRDHPDPRISYKMRKATLYWLHYANIPHDNVMFTNGRKSDRGLDVLLDDAPHNIRSHQEAGEPVIIFDQPWNREVEGLRAYNWPDVVRVIHALEQDAYWRHPSVGVI